MNVLLVATGNVDIATLSVDDIVDYKRVLAPALSDRGVEPEE
jgi:hypothetical protein